MRFPDLLSHISLNDTLEYVPRSLAAEKPLSTRLHYGETVDLAKWWTCSFFLKGPQLTTHVGLWQYTNRYEMRVQDGLRVDCDGMSNRTEIDLYQCSIGLPSHIFPSQPPNVATSLTIGTPITTFFYQPR